MGQLKGDKRPLKPKLNALKGNLDSPQGVIYINHIDKKKHNGRKKPIFIFYSVFPVLHYLTHCFLMKI